MVSSLSDVFRHGFDREALSAVATLFTHSILKQLMTDGSAYVMTFTELLSLKSQAVYDAVEKVGSLVARIVLTPLEEMCYAYFSNNINKNTKIFVKNADSHDSLIENFATTLHVASVVGIVVTDSHDSLIENFSTTLHVASVVGIVVTVFGIPYSPLAVFSHGGFLFISAIGHLVLSFILCSYMNASGFIIANAINMLFRIGYR
ncbi:unnamed protein product [Strongylus vulgaris]|uniref:Protein RFT1 homolog n=1 Tax=Strongylus vulgaris TaxID=40348 RepID=A0A3P7J9S1_STRVU|nr:unnamed protein product [Strongylus vulgaris]